MARLVLCYSWAQSNPQRAGGQPGGKPAGISSAEFEKSEVILRGPGKQVGNWLNRSDSAPAFLSNDDDEAESLLSGRLKWAVSWCRNSPAVLPPGQGGADKGQGAPGHL